MSLDIWLWTKYLMPIKGNKVLTIDDLDIEKEGVGLKASPTKVFRSFTPAPKGKGVMLEGSAEEMAENWL